MDLPKTASARRRPASTRSSTGCAISTIRAAANMAKWETRPSPRRDQSGQIARGRGFAYVKYENARTSCAHCLVASATKHDIDAEQHKLELSSRQLPDTFG